MSHFIRRTAISAVIAGLLTAATASAAWAFSDDETLYINAIRSMGMVAPGGGDDAVLRGGEQICLLLREYSHDDIAAQLYKTSHQPGSQILITQLQAVKTVNAAVNYLCPGW